VASHVAVGCRAVLRPMLRLVGVVVWSCGMQCGVAVWWCGGVVVCVREDMALCRTQWGAQPCRAAAAASAGLLAAGWCAHPADFLDCAHNMSTLEAAP
jgi:hypothetical protein